MLRNELTGEGAINLTASGIFPAQPTKCITFANVIAATVTGNSDSADFKDTILTDMSGVGISNCGEIRVTKDTDPEGGTGNFPYTITRADNSALRFDGSVSAPERLTSDGDSDLVKDIKVGTNYKLAEGPLDPSWVLQSITCTKNGTSYDVVPGNANFSVDASTITECEIKNVPKPKLTLVKAVVNNNGGTAAPSVWTSWAAARRVLGHGEFAGAVTGKTVNGGQQYTLSESNWTDGVCHHGAVVVYGRWNVCQPGQDHPQQRRQRDLHDHERRRRARPNLIKIVHNNDGGTNGPADFTLTANGAGCLRRPGSSAAANAPVLAGVLWAVRVAGARLSATGGGRVVGGTLVGPTRSRSRSAERDLHDQQRGQHADVEAGQDGHEQRWWFGRPADFTLSAVSRGRRDA